MSHVVTTPQRAARPVAVTALAGRVLLRDESDPVAERRRSSVAGRMIPRVDEFATVGHDDLLGGDVVTRGGDVQVREGDFATVAQSRDQQAQTGGGVAAPSLPSHHAVADVAKGGLVERVRALSPSHDQFAAELTVAQPEEQAV